MATDISIAARASRSKAGGLRPSDEATNSFLHGHRRGEVQDLFETLRRGGDAELISGCSGAGLNGTTTDCTRDQRGELSHRRSDTGAHVERFT